MRPPVPVELKPLSAVVRRLTSCATTLVPAVTRMSRSAEILPRSSSVLVALITTSALRPAAIRLPWMTLLPPGFKVMLPLRVSSTPRMPTSTSCAPPLVVPAYMLIAW